MANIKARKNKDGIITSYTIRVPRGYDSDGNRLKDFIRSYPDKKRGESIPSNWSQKKIQKEVERVATLFEEECRKGGVSVDKITFSEYAKQFLDESYINGTMQESGLASSVDALKRINDVDLNGFGHLELSSINVQHINKFYAALYNPNKHANKATGGALSVGSIRKINSFVSSAFSSACRKQLIQFNPCQYATIPKQTNKKADTFKKENMNDLLAIMEAQKIETKLACYLLMTTGVRVGELCGIQLKDCNFEKNTIKIHNNIQYVYEYDLSNHTKGKRTLKNKSTLKNDDTEKTVSVSSYVMDLIKEFAREKKIINLNSEYFIFSSDGGNTPVNPSTIRHNLYKMENYAIIKKPVELTYLNHQFHTYEVVKFSTGDVVRLTKLKSKDEVTTTRRIVLDIDKNNYADIDVEYLHFVPEHIYPHKFRHTCASMLIFESLDAVAVARQLGHRNVATTMRIYAHAFVKEDNRPANIFDKFIAEAK